MFILDFQVEKWTFCSALVTGFDYAHPQPGQHCLEMARHAEKLLCHWICWTYKYFELDWTREQRSVLGGGQHTQGDKLTNAHILIG